MSLHGVVKQTVYYSPAASVADHVTSRTEIYAHIFGAFTNKYITYKLDWFDWTLVCGTFLGMFGLFALYSFN